MEAPSRPHPADPEFDAGPPSSVRLRDFDPQEHQRLVVNPFLAAFALMAWWQSAGWLLRGAFPPIAVASIIPLILLPTLIHYHCVDCGRTGTYPRRREHICPGVFARWNRGPRSRLPFPSAWVQLVCWIYLLGSATLLIAVAAPVGR